MKLTDESKLFIGIILITTIIISIGIVLFNRPSPILSRQELIPPGTSTRGNEQAKTFLVEFSDFQCPSCKEFKPILNSLYDKYKDQILFAYRHFPLESHPFSLRAAQATQAAAQQGKFWEMHDLLFENQAKLSETLIIDLAKQLKLDLEKFQKAFSDEKIKEKILNDLSYGKNLGVRSTPTFFLNGQKLTLFSFDDLRKKVEEEVGKNQ